MRKDRDSCIGDMIVYNYKSNRPYAGIVTKIELCKYGFQNNIYVMWQGQRPNNYNVDHGYAGLSVKNLVHEYQIIRDGEIIK